MDSSGQVIGSLPDWLQLGPVMEVNGSRVREVLGDWSSRHEDDQLPRYIFDGQYVANNLSTFDRSETRAPIEQNKPGRPIQELKGIHSGKVAILFNGPSMKQHELWSIKVPIIGMNRTHKGWPGYDGPDPDYLCLVDPDWFIGKRAETALRHPAIINGGINNHNIGWRATRHPRMAPFSFDMGRDGYASPVPCTTGHLALQLAVYMGFTEIYCIGWDMGGRHFDDTKGSPNYHLAVAYHRRQAPLLRERGINVYVCGSPDSAVQWFEHAPFEAVC